MDIKLIDEIITKGENYHKWYMLKILEVEKKEVIFYNSHEIEQGIIFTEIKNAGSEEIAVLEKNGKTYNNQVYDIFGLFRTLNFEFRIYREKKHGLFYGIYNNFKNKIVFGEGEGIFELEERNEIFDFVGYVFEG